MLKKCRINAERKTENGKASQIFLTHRTYPIKMLLCIVPNEAISQKKSNHRYPLSAAL